MDSPKSGLKSALRKRPGDGQKRARDIYFLLDRVSLDILKGRSWEEVEQLWRVFSNANSASWLIITESGIERFEGWFYEMNKQFRLEK